METETIFDILREMESICTQADYSTGTKLVVASYAERLTWAYNRELEYQKRMITEMKEALNGNDK